MAGGASGGAATAGGAGESAAPEGGATSENGAEEERTEERMEAAQPETAAQDAAADDDASAEGAEAEGSFDDGASPSAGAGDAAPAGAAMQAAAADTGDTAADAGPTTTEPASTPPSDPQAAERMQRSDETRSVQADMRRGDDEGTAERADAQVEQQADAGNTPATGSEGELSEAEKSAALSEVGEGGGGGGDAAAASAGGGGGGGGGGAEAAAEEPAAPDTSALAPEAGLGTAASLGPVPAAAALDGVGASIGRTTEEEGASLQQQMPQPEVGSDDAGVASAADAYAEADGDGDGATEATAAVDAGPSTPTPEPAALPPAPPAPTQSIATPSVQSGEGGTAKPEDARRVQSAVRNMPTEDAGLDVSAGAPPTLALQGDADPATADAQKAALDQTVATQQSQGAADAAAPAGENAIRARQPREVLQPPALAAPAAQGAAGGAADAAAGEEGVAVLADEKQGPEVRAAAAQAQAEMGVRRGEHRAKVDEEKGRSDQEMAQLRANNAAEQAAEKAAAQGEVGQARADWTAEQQAEVKSTNQKAGKELTTAREKVQREQAKGDAEAGQHIATGEAEAGEHKAKAQADAARKKQEAESESDGVFGWLSSKVTAFFDALKRGLTAIFDAAKKLVRAAIDKAKKLAVAAIERARKAVVGLIKAVGAALIALGDVLLAAFPALKRKWRRFITQRVRQAEAAVNRLADALKTGITKLLDALGKAFEFLLDAYKKAMFAVLDVAKGVAMAAIKAAKAVADALGTFVVLVRDIAKNPGGWLANLGSSAMDGVRNHLWGPFKGAVKEWFDSKLDEVLGIGGMVWGMLKKGGIGMKEVGTMAFDGLKAAIPAALIGILIEKVVAMIIPAAGAVIAIIEGLQAAWGTVQRILAAIGKFIAFLKAVKGGGAGPQFGAMVAAAAVVVIDFVANWLLKKLRGPASKIGGKIKAIAKKIMARIKRAAKKAGGALKRAGRKIGAKLKGAKKRFDDWRAKRQAKRDAKNGKDPKAEAERRKRDKERAKEERLRKAVAAIGPALQKLLAGGASRPRLWAQLGFWRLRYRLTALQLQRSGGSFSLLAKVNPQAQFGAGLIYEGAQLSVLIRQVVREELLSLPGVDQRRQQAPGASSDIRSAQDLAGHAMQSREQLGQHAPIHFGQTFKYPSWNPHQVNYHPPGVAGGLPVQEFRARMGASGGPLDRVVIPGSSGAYPHLANSALPGLMQSTGMNDRALAAQMRLFAQGGNGSAMSPQALSTMGATSHLVFGTESARSAGNLVTAPMTAQLVEGGHLSWQQALSPRTSPVSLPMAGAGAPQRSRGLEGALQEQTGIAPRAGGQGTTKGAEGMAASEEALVIAWVTQVAGGAVAAGNEESIRSLVRKFVRDWYRIQSPTRRR